MTKHSPDDTLKCHLFVEEPKKLVEKNEIKVPDFQNSLELKSKISPIEIKSDFKPNRITWQEMVPKLDNLEDNFDTKKKVKINLDSYLYQMERGY